MQGSLQIAQYGDFDQNESMSQLQREICAIL